MREEEGHRKLLVSLLGMVPYDPRVLQRVPANEKQKEKGKETIILCTNLYVCKVLTSAPTVAVCDEPHKIQDLSGLLHFVCTYICTRFCAYVLPYIFLSLLVSDEVPREVRTVCKLIGQTRPLSSSPPLHHDVLLPLTTPHRGLCSSSLLHSQTKRQGHNILRRGVCPQGLCRNSEKVRRKKLILAEF